MKNTERTIKITRYFFIPLGLILACLSILFIFRFEDMTPKIQIKFTLDQANNDSQEIDYTIFYDSYDPIRGYKYSKINPKSYKTTTEINKINFIDQQNLSSYWPRTQFIGISIIAQNKTGDLECVRYLFTDSHKNISGINHDIEDSLEYKKDAIIEVECVEN